MEHRLAMTRTPPVSLPGVERPAAGVQTDSRHMLIRVKSSDTGKAVRSIPPAKVQRRSEVLSHNDPVFLDLRACVLHAA